MTTQPDAPTTVTGCDDPAQKSKFVIVPRADGITGRSCIGCGVYVRVHPSTRCYCPQCAAKYLDQLLRMRGEWCAEVEIIQN